LKLCNQYSFGVKRAKLKILLAEGSLIRVVMVRVVIFMNTSSIPAKFMRPRKYAERVGINWRTAYREGLWPAYKFQGILLVDVEEIDAILKGLIRQTAENREQRKVKKEAAVKARAVKAFSKAQKIKAAAEKARTRAQALTARAQEAAAQAAAKQELAVSISE
jgi:hypothetical protein